MAPDTTGKLSPERKKALRAIGHNLNPVVTIAGKGVSDAVLAELNRALDDHELIKVRVTAADREEKQALIHILCEQTGATLVQTIGHVALILREAKKPKRALSNLRRR